MAESGETNPYKTTAPGSDNTQSGGAPDWYDKGMTEVLEKQLKAQQDQTDQLEKLAERLKENQSSINEAQMKGFLAAQENDKEALAVAEKELYVSLRAQEENQRNMGLLGTVIKDLQKEIDYSLDVLAMDARVDTHLARTHLNATQNGNKELESKLESLAKEANESSSSFMQFVNDFSLQQKAGKEFDDDALSTSNTKISSASSGVGMGGDTNSQISAVIQKTGVTLETLAVINEHVADAMETAGVDTTDKAATDRFKMTMASDNKVRDTIVKELVKSRETIKQDTVKKELQEMYLKHGTGAAVAEIMAQKNAAAETAQRRKDVNEQIRIFKSLDETQRFQTTLVEADYRQRIEAEKEGGPSVPEWARNLVDSANLSNAILKDMREALSGSGVMMKILLALALISGVIIGIVVDSIKRILAVFKATGAIGGIFAKLRNAVPIVDKVVVGFQTFLRFLKEGTTIGRFIFDVIGKGVSMFKNFMEGIKFISTAAKEGGVIMKLLGSIIRPVVQIFNAFMKGFQMGSGAIGWLSKLGPLLGKIFLPISIALTVIDAVIGAFKGFKKDGFAGIIPGIIAKIISGLTLGFVSFETLYKYIKIATDIWLIPIKIMITLAKYVMTGLGLVWDLVSDIFSGKGIKASLMKFLGNLGSAFTTLLTGLYDVTIGPFMKLFNWGSKEGAKSSKEGEGILSKVFNVLKFMNPFYLIYRGVMYFVDWVVENKEMVLNALKMLGNFLLKSNPIYLMYKGFQALGNWLGSMMPDAIKAIVDVVQGIFNSIINSISGLLSWIPGLGGDVEAAPTNKMATPTTKNLITKSTPTGAGSSGEARSLTKAQRDMSYEEKKSLNQKAIQNISSSTNNSTVVNGGKSSPTIIAPQPPRNSEPTIRGMQFGEQPAF